MRMFSPMKVLIAAVSIVLLAGCKTENEKIQDTLEAFVEAVVVHRAPYNAYVYLDPEDKEHFTVEEYAARFEQLEKPVSPQARFTVGDVTIKNGRAESTVRVAPPEGDPELRRYVLRRDAGKWRVWLGLSTLTQMREKLDDAKRLAEDGAIEEAKEKVEAVASSPFLASRPDVIEQEAAMLRNTLLERERSVALDAQLSRAMTAADLDEMRREAEELATKISDDDATFYPRLVALRAALEQREKHAAIESLEVEAVRARSYRDSWGSFREARFKIANVTGRPLAHLEVRVELLNEEGQPPIGHVTWDVLEEDETLRPGATLNVKREIDKAPRAWEGKEIAVVITDLEFADSATDDADEG